RHVRDAGIDELAFGAGRGHRFSVAALLEVIVGEDCPVPSGPQRLRVFHRLSSFVALTGPGQRETETVGGGNVVRLLGERGAEGRKRLRIVLLLEMGLPDVDLVAAVSR